MQDLVRRLLAELGEDPEREGCATRQSASKRRSVSDERVLANIDQVLNNALVHRRL
jgi:hypothetical protein